MASALWSMWTHAFDLFDIAPQLDITSPTRKCGKTTMLKLIGCVCARRLFSSNITGPVLFRVIEKYQPTLLIDEADNFAKFNDELKGLLNAGHERMTAQATRTVGDNYDVRTFSTWAPKAFTAIGALPDTVEDRSIRIMMLRKPTDLPKDHARMKALTAGGDPLARRCVRWAQDNALTIRAAAEPELPDLHDDRAADNWAPLIVIADLCGARVRAEEAARALTGGGELGLDELLLLHVREAFGTDHDWLGTGELLEVLVARDDAPWARFWADDVSSAAGWKKAAAALARRLRKFDPKLKAGRRRDGDERDRGYSREQFADMWSRWLPPIEDAPKDQHLAEPPKTLALLAPLGQPDDLGPQNGSLTSGNRGRAKGPKGSKVSEGRESVVGPNPGDIVRVDAVQGARFKVKAMEDGTVHAWELEAGIAGKLRSFRLPDVAIVQRNG